MKQVRLWIYWNGDSSGPVFKPYVINPREAINTYVRYGVSLPTTSSNYEYHYPGSSLNKFVIDWNDTTDI